MPASEHIIKTSRALALPAQSPPPRVEGDWAHLHNAVQTPRYSDIAALVARHAPKPTHLLDIGCGTGQLSRFLSAEIEYFGIEQSAEAVRERISVRVIGGNVEVYPVVYHREAVIFSETLYYLADPCAVLERYAQWLTPQGVFVITIWQRMDASGPLRRMLARLLGRDLNPNLTATAKVDRWLRAKGTIVEDYLLPREGGTSWRVWCWKRES